MAVARRSRSRSQTGGTVALVLGVALLVQLPAQAAPIGAKRGYGEVSYVSMLKRPNAPQLKRHTLRVFTRGASDNTIQITRGDHSAVAAYDGQNNGFEEWWIRRTDSPDASKLVRALTERLYRKGKVKLYGASFDPLEPISLVYECKLTGFNNLGTCDEMTESG